MESIQQLEIKATELFKSRQYSKVVFEITSSTIEEERSAFLCNLLGLSKNAYNNKNKETLKEIRYAPSLKTSKEIRLDTRLPLFLSVQRD